MKKVLIITYYWPPSGGAGVQRWVKFVKYLPDLGIEPIVLTVDPQYASYPLIDKTLEQEIPDSIKVLFTRTREPFNFYQNISGKKEIPHSGFANQTEVSFFGKISRFVRGNFFIPDPRKGWNKYAVVEAKKLIKKNDITTVITTSPPHSTQLIGLQLKKEFDINWIADIRDPWTDIYYYDKLYHTRWARRIDQKYESLVLENADRLIVVSNAIKDQFLAKSNQITESKFSVIPNGYDEEDFKQDRSLIQDQFIITYTGTIAPNYDIEGFIDALKEFFVMEKNIRLRFVGAVSENFKKMINETSLCDITEFIDHVKHEESINFLMRTSVLFLAIPHSKNNKGVLTGKLFEYLAARKPIIAVGPVDGDAARIIQECNAGRMFDYGDRKEIHIYLEELFSKWKKQEEFRFTNTKIRSYSRKNLTGKLLSLTID